MWSLTVRRWHSYIGLLAAPSVIFFALTGAAQIYGLHEAHGHYQPPALLEKLSSVHKDQVFAMGHHHEAPKTGADEGTPDDDDAKTPPATPILKAFFLVVALLLTVSTAFGVWMGVTQTRRPRLAWFLLLSGALIPLILVLV